jgi:hypothetical protein
VAVNPKKRVIAIRWGRALLGGFVGALAALLVLLAAWWLMRFDFFASDALRAALPSFSWLRVIGGAIVLLAGGPVIALSYALVFEYVTRFSGLLLGAVLGFVHGLVVWLACGLIPWLFPNVGAAFADAFSLLFFGTAIIIAFAVAHILYGALLGRVYGEPLHRFEAENAVEWRVVYSREETLVAD